LVVQFGADRGAGSVQPGLHRGGDDLFPGHDGLATRPPTTPQDNRAATNHQGDSHASNDPDGHGDLPTPVRPTSTPIRVLTPPERIHESFPTPDPSALNIPVAVAELHRGSLADDTAAATEAMNELPGPVVACGHSYGGMVITGLDPDRIAHLVYLAAPMPDTSETALDLVAAHPSDLLTSIVGDLGATTTIDPAKAGDLFYPQLSKQQQAP